MSNKDEQEKILTTKLLRDLVSANILYDFISSFISDEFSSVEEKESALSNAKKFLKYINNIGLEEQQVEKLTNLLNETILILEREINEIKK